MEKLAAILKKNGIKYKVKRVVLSTEWRDQDGFVLDSQSQTFVPVVEIDNSEMPAFNAALMRDAALLRAFSDMNLEAVSFQREDDPFEYHLRIVRKMCAEIG
jgi:hypothetical protein